MKNASDDQNCCFPTISIPAETTGWMTIQSGSQDSIVKKECHGLKHTRLAEPYIKSSYGEYLVQVTRDPLNEFL